MAATGALSHDLTDVVGFAEFRQLDDEALHVSLAHWKRLPPWASLPASRHFFIVHFELDRWRSGGHFQFDLRGEALRLEGLEGASDFNAGRPRGSGLLHADSGSVELEVRLVLDRHAPVWASTGDPVLPKRTVRLTGWGIVRSAGAVTCDVLRDPPPAPPPPPPPKLPPDAWLRPQPPPSPPPVWAPPPPHGWLAGAAASGSAAAGTLVGIFGGLGVGGAVAAFVVCFLRRERRRRGPRRTAVARSKYDSGGGDRPSKPRGRTSNRTAPEARPPPSRGRKGGRERVPTHEPMAGNDDDDTDTNTEVLE